MRLLLVTFSLRNPSKDYSGFFVAIRGNALNWWHFIEQSCVVSTTHDADAFARLLFPHLETSDSVLVVEIKPHQFQGWLPQAAWEWLNQTSDKIAPVKVLDGQWLPLPKLPKPPP